MQEKTESVVYDYKYVCLDKSGVLSLDDTPCDVKFWTNRPADWFRASIKYYTNLYDDGALTHKPSIKLSKRGDHLRIYGETYMSHQHIHLQNWRCLDTRLWLWRMGEQRYVSHKIFVT